MPAESLAPSLESYQIGPRIRALRKCKNLSLVKLGEHTGMSAGLLSKIERGRLIPTLPTLLRIAMVFGVGLDHFFSKEATPRPTASVVRRKERLPAQSHRRRRANLLFRKSGFSGDRPQDGGVFRHLRIKCTSDGAAYPSRRGGHLCRQRRFGRQHRGREHDAQSRRLDLFRLFESAQLSPKRKANLLRRSGRDELGKVRCALSVVWANGCLTSANGTKGTYSETVSISANCHSGLQTALLP